MIDFSNIKNTPLLIWFLFNNLGLILNKEANMLMILFFKYLVRHFYDFKLI